MERGSGSNNGTPRFRRVRVFGVDITLPENGDRRQQPTALQVQSVTISEAQNPIEYFAPGITRNRAFQSFVAGSLFRRTSNQTSGATPPSEVAALPQPPLPPPHTHPHQPAVAAVPPPLPRPNTHADNLTDAYAGNLARQVEIGLQEATGENVDPGMVDALVEVIEDTLEGLEGNMDHDEILNVQLSIELEEIMEEINDDQQDNPGLSEEVIMSLLGSSTFETSSEDKDSCCICLDEFSTGDELGDINCNHKYHFMCILEWLKHNNICPICRAIALSVS